MERGNTHFFMFSLKPPADYCIIITMNLKHIGSVVSALIILTGLAIAAHSAEQAPKALKSSDMEVRVLKIIDGDTFSFKRPDRKKPDKCRMLHYNAPEMDGPERPQGIKARGELFRLMAGQRVMLRGAKRDKYKRLLCEVRLKDGTYVNDVMREFLKDYPGRDKYLWMEQKDAKGRKK